jgi:hypothetical protein
MSQDTRVHIFGVDNIPPSPTDLISKHTAQQRADDTRNTIRSRYDTRECRTLNWRDGERGDAVATTQYARCSDADDCAAGDESGVVWCDGAEETADFEDADREEEDPFQIEKLWYGLVHVPHTLEVGTHCSLYPMATETRQR